MSVYLADTFTERVVRLTADITGPTDATSNALANITGLAFAVGASEEWEAEARILYTTNATTTGFFLTATVPSSPTAFVGEVSGSSGATTNQIRHFNAGDGGSAFGNALSGNNIIIGRFVLRNGANAGNLQLRYASELASNGVVVKAGSFLKYRRLA